MGGRGMSSEVKTKTGEESSEAFVTVMTAGQLFGLALDRVRDVFVPRGLTTVPLAPSEIAGLLNLRGRVVTAIDLRLRLGFAPRSAGVRPVAMGIEKHGELFGLVVDKVIDVMRLPNSSFEPNPVNLDPRWMRVCAGVCRLERDLMVVLDIDKVLDLSQLAAVA